MKKLIACTLTIVFTLLCLVGCTNPYLPDTWYTEERLNTCLVPELPRVSGSFVSHNDKTVYANLTDEEFDAYVSSVYAYLISQEFDHLGTRGEVKSSLAGALATYYFKEVETLDEFIINGKYIFVFANSNEDGSAPTFNCIIILRDEGTVGRKNNTFSYNTLISIYNEDTDILNCSYSIPDMCIEHTYEYICYGDAHMKTYTCGCVFQEIMQKHYDYNHDNVCDACEAEIKKDDNPFLTDLSGTEWFTGISSFDIAELQLIEEAVGVAPGNLRYISSTTNLATISRILLEFKAIRVTPTAEPMPDGGGAVTLKVIMKNGKEYSLYINNGCYTDKNGDRYELPFIPSFNYVPEYTQRYGFISYYVGCDVYQFFGCMGEFICKIPLSELEFVETTIGDVPEGGIEYQVQTDFGTLYFVSDTEFFVGSTTGAAYKLVGKTLPEIIEFALSPSYSIDMHDPKWLYEDLKDSYAPGETVSVKIKTALDMGFVFLLDGKMLQPSNDVSGKYWEFTFIMPEHPVEIDFITYDGFLPDWNYAKLIEAYCIKNPRERGVRITEYCGEYESGAIVAMIYSQKGYDDVYWHEVLCGETFTYANSNRLLVLLGGEFFTLSDAYNRGILTEANIIAISNIYNG